MSVSARMAVDALIVKDLVGSGKNGFSDSRASENSIVIAVRVRVLHTAG